MSALQWSQIYSSGGPHARETRQGVAQAQPPADKQAAPAEQPHTTIAWLGIVIALVLLRIIYEVSE
jgi:hypothetical protein